MLSTLLEKSIERRKRVLKKFHLVYGIIVFFSYEFPANKIWNEIESGTLIPHGMNPGHGLKTFDYLANLKGNYIEKSSLVR